MKMWIKYLLGIALGLIAAFILPENFIRIISELAVRFGSYMVLPVLFFGAASAFFKLRTTKTLLKTTKWTAITILGSSLILTCLGLISILVVFKFTVPENSSTNIFETLQKLGLVSSDVSDLTDEAKSAVIDSTLKLDIKNLVMSILPFSIFEDFGVFKAGAFLLPCLVFAGFAGAGCAMDTTASKQLVSLIESAATVCYSVMCFFIEWFAVALVAVSCMWMKNTLSIENLSTFRTLIIILLVDFVLIVGVIYPLVLRFVCKDHHPYHVLFASICPILTGFFSGNSNLTMLVNMRHGRDSLGIHQPVADVTFPLFSIFARGGSALVTAIGFIIIIRSNNLMDFNLGSILFIFCLSFLISFVLGAYPQGGAFVALAAICGLYKYGIYSDLKFLLSISPVALILCSFAAAIDSATSMFGSYIIGVKTKMIEHIEVKRYI